VFEFSIGVVDFDPTIIVSASAKRAALNDLLTSKFETECSDDVCMFSSSTNAEGSIERALASSSDEALLVLSVSDGLSGLIDVTPLPHPHKQTCAADKVSGPIAFKYRIKFLTTKRDTGEIRDATKKILAEEKQEYIHPHFDLDNLRCKDWSSFLFVWYADRGSFLFLWYAYRDLTKRQLIFLPLLIVLETPESAQIAFSETLIISLELEQSTISWCVL